MAAEANILFAEDRLQVVGLTADSASGLKILVVDDSAIYRRLVELSFAKSPHTILFAKDGREALRLFAEQKPALVITDWTMPDISGIELCQRIRSDFPHLYPYVILLTGNSDKEEVIEGLAAGADDYLTKPFHPGELQARVNVGLRIVDLHRQIHAKNRQLEQLALADHLTGLPNRRAIEMWVAPQLAAAVRHSFAIWVVMVDLDHFKKVNDMFGHDVGDSVLRSFAEVLKSNTRESNICGRMGGEEFLVIITHVEKEAVRIAIERIRTQFEEKIFTVGGTTFGVTASFGIADLHGTDSPNLADLVRRADLALYSAKENGRNRIEFLLK
jgi:two-component system, cell cycle response regulator